MKKERRYEIQDVKKYIEFSFVPAMREIFKAGDPKKYELFHGNCCRQTAVFICRLLTELLPEFTWTAWGGDFKDVIMGQKCQYWHAWVYGKSNDKRYFIDMARILKENLFIEVESNKYPKTHKDCICMEELSRERLDWKKMFYGEDFEFYTSLPSYKVFESILFMTGNVDFLKQKRQ